MGHDTYVPLRRVSSHAFTGIEGTHLYVLYTILLGLILQLEKNVPCEYQGVELGSIHRSYMNRLRYTEPSKLIVVHMASFLSLEVFKIKKVL